jgi:hypothetical protein
MRGTKMYEEDTRVYEERYKTECGEVLRSMRRDNKVYMERY